ncbi:MAG: Fe-S-cluster-containing hydrogenase subunit [Bacteroidota bacterium]|nr:Fe-S-cluster-containing hydrogenase subunit [Bacteroidota bacterium]
MSNKKYWSSLDELNETPQYIEKASKEFNYEIDADDAGENDGPSRRDFLKAMGFSVSIAALASACKMPTHKAIPYTFDLRKPVPEVVPGVADFFASTYYEGGDFVSILVKTREGRPIKIEGNSGSPLTLGGTSARAQASVLSLYDVTRLATPTKKNKKADWKTVDAEIMQKLAGIATSGGKIALVTGTVASTITKKAIEKFVSKFPGTTVVSYDAVSSYATRKANQISLGSPIIPTINYDKADVIVGFNADFLGTGISTVEAAKKYVATRVPSKTNPKMSRHHQFQSTMSMTGASADYRYPVAPSEEKQALINLLSAVGGSVSGVANLKNQIANDGIKKVAAELLAAKGKSVIVSGTNDVDIQLLVNAINGVLGNYGSVIDTAGAYNLKSGNDEALAALASDLEKGIYKGIVLLGSNPVYDTPYGETFKKAIQGAELSVSTADRTDESAQYCQYVCPDSHYLESWDIVSPKTGFYGFVQPAIVNLFDTRQAQSSLLTWSGDTTPIGQFVQNEIAALTGGNYQAAVQTGYFGNATSGGAGANVGASIAAVKTGASAPKGMEVFFYEKVAIGDGKLANNPFLQEMPDPVAKVTWDNYVCVPYSFAKDKGIDVMPYDKKVPIAKVVVNGKAFELPVVVQFGQAQNTLAIAMGYGRERAGRAGSMVGKNMFPFIKSTNGISTYATDGASIEFTGATYDLALNQTYHTLMEDRKLPGKKLQYRGMVVKETTLKDYQKKDNAGNEDREKIKEELHSLYDGYKPHDYKQGHHWGMTVDLNACIGCGACVVACSIENNVPVVGRRQVYRSQEMQWIRIDRYYNGNPDNPDVSFQPMMCQHCNNAPCENVCPVNATNHSSEGLNQMVYNRCIGTKYCANNCPYKVRRFNWLDYQGNDSWGKFNDGKRSFTDTEAQSYMFEDLTRMVLNPDVVTRTRGVMEKCSFCVQRIQEGKLNAKKEDRLLQDGEIKTACQSACPTNAITFGDQNNKESAVAKTFAENGRNYFIFEEQHFIPAVGYQVKVRNKNEEPIRGFIQNEEPYL